MNRQSDVLGVTEEVTGALHGRAADRAFDAGTITAAAATRAASRNDRQPRVETFKCTLRPCPGSIAATRANGRGDESRRTSAPHFSSERSSRRKNYFLTTVTDSVAK